MKAGVGNLLRRRGLQMYELEIVLRRADMQVYIIIISTF